MKKFGFSVASILLLLVVALSMTYAAPAQQELISTSDITAVVMTATELARIFATQDAPTATLTITRPPSQTPTITPLQSMTPTPTATSTLQPAIAAQTATAFWEDFAPPANPTPAPASSNRERITPENAAQVEQIGILGRGYIRDVRWTPDDQGLVVYGEVASVYDPYDFSLPARSLISDEILPEPLFKIEVDRETTTTYVVDTVSGEKHLTIPNLDYFEAIFNADYTLLATLDVDKGGVKVFDLISGQEIFSQADARWFADFSPNPNVLVFTTIEDGGWPFIATLHLVDLRTKETIVALPVNGFVNSVTFSPDNRFLGITTYGFIFGGDDSIRIWDIATGTEYRVLAEDTKDIWHIAFNADGTLIAGGSAYGQLGLWDVETAEQIAFSDHSAFTKQIVFSPNGKTLASYNYSSVKLWNLATGSQKTIFDFPEYILPIVDMAYDSTGNILATLSSENGEYWLRLWATDTGDLVQEIHILAEQLPAILSGLSPVTPGAQIQVLSIGMDEQSLPVDFSLDKLLGFRGRTSPIQFIDTKTLKAIITLDDTNHHNAIAFNQDRNLLAISYNYPGKVTLWDTSELPFKITPIRDLLDSGAENNGYWYFTNAIAFSPDGKILAVAGDPEIRLWDVETGTLLTVLHGHHEAVDTLAFSPDGALLASAGGGATDGAFEQITSDSAIRLWGVPEAD